VTAIWILEALQGPEKLFGIFRDPWVTAAYAMQA